MAIERRKRGADRRRDEVVIADGDRRSGLGDRRAGVRLGVQKTYKLYVGGQFVRSESGRYSQAKDVAGGTPGAVQNVAKASRKDGRDAVSAAAGALAAWSGKTAYNRGQILYRLAEMMEARATELGASLVRSLGVSGDDARREVEASIDRAVAYAGWADKYQSLLATSNPVAGPHFNFSVPEPVGVVAIVAPSRPSLLGLVSAVLPVITAGNVCVVLASEADPRTALVFAEALATSDLPGGVVNVLTGSVKEVAPHLAKHMEVGALDLWLEDGDLAKGLEEAATVNVKRVRRRALAEAAFYDCEAMESPLAIERFVETKTVWHPAGW